MRFQRRGPEGAERPVVLDEQGRALDLSPVTADIDGAFLAGNGIAAARDALPTLSEVDTTGLRVGPPVTRPGKDVRHVVWYLSQFMVLDLGDVVNTATPAGVAFGANDFPYLRAGDVVEVEIDRLGRQRHVVGHA
ncbi:fumarylacetoacetate hydrolase family protein [Actinophytocola sp.]|uniref:fumarylacetoacetate hydrolase family protein n=1 Tax=Actinophytocola sp. TaxID=1872138 RepID=UPI0038998ABD